jgi:hypothetical protein
VAAVHAALVSFAFLPVFVSTSSKRLLPEGYAAESLASPADVAPAKLLSTTSLFKGNRVDISGVVGWSEHASEAVHVVNRCEKLYQTFLSAEGRHS